MIDRLKKVEEYMQYIRSVEEYPCGFKSRKTIWCFTLLGLMVPGAKFVEEEKCRKCSYDCPRKKID